MSVIKIVLISSLLVTLVMGSKAQAQEDDIFMEPEQAASQKVEFVDLPDLAVENMPPLFWTSQELALINQIKSGIVPITPLDEQSLLDDSTAPISNNDDKKLYYAPRQLTLNGVVFKSDSDWVIWLNGLRITPKTTLEPIQSVRVAQDQIEIKWYDALTDRVFPVKLRPHQKFDFDIKAFLPG